MFKLLRLFVKHFRKSNLVNLLKFIQMNTKKMGVLSGLMLVFLSLSSFTTVLDFQPSIHAVEVSKFQNFTKQNIRLPIWEPFL